MEFDGTVATNLQAGAEHYEVNTSPVGADDSPVRSVRRATNPASMAIYEEVSPQDENVPNCTSEKKHRPLGYTKSVPLEEKTSQTIPQAKPKVVPRQNLELHDQTSITSEWGKHAEEVVDDVTGNVVGVVKLAPAPAPRSWKKSKTLQNDSGFGQGDEGRFGYFGDSQEPCMEDEDLYTIPLNAENENTPEPSPSIQEMMEAVEAIPLESVHFATSGQETWSVSKERVDRKIQHQQPLSADLDEGVVQTATVEDGRESSSSFLRECLSEFDKIKSSELPSNSPTHIMVNIDEMNQQKDQGGNEGVPEDEVKRQGDVDDEKSHRHSYENQVIVDQNKDGNNKCDVLVVEHYEMNTVNPTEESTHNSQGAVGEDLSQTVKKPAIELDDQGYCKVEVSKNKDQSLSLVEDVLSHFENTTLSDLPPLSQDDNITNYDMKTVEHPPVTTNAQGYSYCGIDLRSPSELTAGGTGFSTSHDNSGYPAAPDPPPPRGYTGIEVSSSGVVVDHPTEREDHAERDPRPPETAPKPSRRKGEPFKPLDNAEMRGGVAEVEEGLLQAAVEEDTKTELSDTDSLYARVLDVTKEPSNNVDSSPKPSPKPKRKKQAAGGVGKPKAKKKGQGPPRRRPPPPPPPGARIPGSALLPPTTSTVPPTPPFSAPCLKMSTQSEAEHRFEQTLPPFPSYQPANQGSPLHQPASAADDSFTSSLPPLPPLLGSPKLPGRKGPLPPSPTAGSPQTGDPPSPIHRRGLLNRIKSSSLKTRKPDNHSPTTVSPLLADEFGRVGGDQSPKVGWKNKFRFRRSSGNSASTMDSSMPGEEYVGEACGGAGHGESRKRRNQEDKLPEVPPTAKSRSLPSPSRQGIHRHPYDGEEEEIEDGLYSVVNKPAKTVQRPQVRKCILLLPCDHSGALHAASCP